MLRKRWIVRNPVVGEDDVTQFIKARSFSTSWPRGLFVFYIVLRELPDKLRTIKPQ